MMDRAALLEAISLVLLTDQAGEGVPDGPDAELIRWCNRLKAAEDVYAQAHEVIVDDQERADILAPLGEWFDEIAERLRELDGPTTPAGARAAALVLMMQCQSDDLAGWLTVRCARYLARQVVE